MTDFVAARVARGFKNLGAVVCIGLLAAGLGGCETAGSLFGGSPSASTEAPPAVAVQAKPLTKVAFSPVIGAPDVTGKQLISQVGEVSERNRFSVIPDSRQADYTMRGYFVAARDKTGSKVSYIWDVADNTGKRVNRISGEVVAAGQPSAKDPWSNVTPAVTKSIAEATATSLAAWLPNSGAAVAGKPAASTPVAAAPSAGAGATGVPPAPTPVAVVQPLSTNTTTAALPKAEEVAAVVPLVAGAPGDGNSTLSAALQRELSRQGVALVDKPGISYRVEGKVVMGQTADGKQPIQIDWRVKDPQGKALGTVSQKNEIPPGSLDGAWGKVADAAAAAAAQGILKLLPQAKSTN